ncbi:hypothetical protein HPP92_026899 [Vanilla planifolia]|uniref:Uncharacterized protein n=1 Tax=Vanilla planifolia TaxID=51239 RepID=A0A835PB84_VANPL|nr:hypothetical protein HPP92_026899 [Vanilla planifolia]
MDVEIRKQNYGPYGTHEIRNFGWPGPGSESKKKKQHRVSKKKKQLASSS